MEEGGHGGLKEEEKGILRAEDCFVLLVDVVFDGGSLKKYGG